MIQAACTAVSATLAAAHNLARATAERNLLQTLSVAELRAVVTIGSWSHTNTASVKGAKMFPWSGGSIDTRNGL